MLYYITPVSPRTSLNLRQQFLNSSSSALAMQQREYRVPEAVPLDCVAKGNGPVFPSGDYFIALSPTFAATFKINSAT